MALAKISLLILCDVADLAFLEFRDPNLATNLFCSLTNWTFVIKYRAEKLKREKLIILMQLKLIIQKKILI